MDYVIASAVVSDVAYAAVAVNVVVEKASY